MEFILTVVVFAACMAGLSIGFIISGKSLRGACKGNPHAHGQDSSCSVCGPEKGTPVPNEDDNGLMALARVSHPHPQHHHEQYIRRIPVLHHD